MRATWLLVLACVSGCGTPFSTYYEVPDATLAAATAAQNQGYPMLHGKRLVGDCAGSDANAADVYVGRNALPPFMPSTVRKGSSCSRLEHTKLNAGFWLLFGAALTEILAAAFYGAPCTTNCDAGRDVFIGLTVPAVLAVAGGITLVVLGAREKTNLPESTKCQTNEYLYIETYGIRTCPPISH